MELRFSPLNLGRAEPTPNSYAVYALRHTPTGLIYFGSTTQLRSRLLQWWYALAPAGASANKPIKFSAIFATFGRNPLDWDFAIIDQAKPATYNPRAAPQERPEWACVRWATVHMPERLLNDPHGHQRRRKDKPVDPNDMGRKGVSPLVYLRGKLGIGTRRYSKQPRHGWPINMQKLKPASHWAVPFAMYLYRAMDQPGERAYNPSREAIAGLYREWVKHVLPHDLARQAGVPYTVQDALELPVPQSYVEDFPVLAELSTAELIAKAEAEYDPADHMPEHAVESFEEMLEKEAAEFPSDGASEGDGEA